MVDKWLPNGDTWELESSLTHYNRITSTLQCKGQRSNNKGHIWQMLWEAIEFRKLAVKSHKRPDRHIGNSLTFQNKGSIQVLWLKKLMKHGERNKERERDHCFCAVRLKVFRNANHFTKLLLSDFLGHS